MKLKTKKTIAREFLFIVGCLFVFILAFLSTLIYNLFIESQIASYQNSIQILNSNINDSIKSILQKEEKQEWFYLASVQQFDYGNKTTTDQVWERWSQLQQADSISYLWYYKWDEDVKGILKKIGFDNLSDLNSFIEENSFSLEEQTYKHIADSINSQLINSKNQLKIQKKRLLNIELKMQISFLCFLLAGIIAFPIRYLIISTKWSIKTLKQR